MVTRPTVKDGQTRTIHHKRTLHKLTIETTITIVLVLLLDKDQALQTNKHIADHKPVLADNKPAVDTMLELVANHNKHQAKTKMEIYHQ